LNVSLNVLKTLEEEALSGYESVRYLYLQHCKIDKINEKAFQRLENLTEIDLSSNRLTSVPPNLFNGNQKLNKLILRNNNLGNLQENMHILNGPSSLSFLVLQSCRLSNISPITFSLLPNLTFLDISRNKLVLLNPDALSSHQKLKDVNLENNPWECGIAFKELLCWMQSKLALSHNRRVICQYRNERWDKWALENQSSLCCPITTPSTEEFLTVMTPDLTTVSVGVPLPPKTSPHTSGAVETAVTNEATPLTGEFLNVMTSDLTSASVGVPLPPETSPHTPQVVETAVTSEAELGALPESETGAWASLLSWNANTLAAFVILPIALGGAVFVSLIAVNYITNRCIVHRPQQRTQGEDNHLAASFDSAVPFLKPRLEEDLTRQPLGYENRSSENVGHNE
jgi:hypothetical protein